MAIAVERNVEKPCGWLIPKLATLFKKKTEVSAVVEKQELVTLKMEDIFASSESLIFTELGSSLFGIAVAKNTISDKEPTSDRHKEVVLEVERRCAKIGISVDQLPEAEGQLFALIKKRESDINDRYKHEE